MADRLWPWLLLGCVVGVSCDDAESPGAWRSGASPSVAAGGSSAPATGGRAASAGNDAAGGERNRAGAAGDGFGGSDGGAGATASGGANSGGSEPSAGGGNGPTGGAPNPSCSLDPSGLLVTPTWDDLGYPSYAIDGCRLVYVAADGSLRLRTSDESEVELEPASNRPRRPALTALVLAWEATLEGKTQVRVWTPSGPITLSGAFDHAGEPAASGKSIAFTAFKSPGANSDSDVLLYDTETRSVAEALGGPGQQRFSAISGDLIAASDFSEDPRGYFDELGSLSDIVVRRMGEEPIVRHREGKQAFPMLTDDGTLGYLDWGSVHPEPKFSAFTLYVARDATALGGDVKIRAIETDPSYVRPSLGAGFVDYVDRTSGKPLLYRQSLESLVDSPPLTDFGAGLVPLGPVARKAFTLLATRGSDGSRLRVVVR